ncbi:mitochondrial transcription factor A [Augochlora pura]
MRTINIQNIIENNNFKIIILVKNLFTMAGLGRFIPSVNPRSFLYPRNCFVKISQINSKPAEPEEPTVQLPNKPKKPLTSFLLFTSTVRSKLLKTNPEIKPYEIIKIASQEWANLDPAVKENFKHQYDESYKQYAVDIKQYNESLTDQQKLLLIELKEKSKQKSASMDMKRKKISFEKPRKPRNAFLIYLQHQRSNKNPDVLLKDWVSGVTKRWSTMTNEEKQVYINEATMLMDKYKKDIVSWERNMVSLGHPEMLRRKTYKNLYGSVTEDKK